MRTVLFSDERVAEFVQSHFEPTWQSVRPVPLIHIDFGNGLRVTRTLNGNVATYICLPEGIVFDVVPGLYTAQAYIEALSQVLTEYRKLDKQGDLQAQLRNYHLTALEKSPTRSVVMSQQTSITANSVSPPRFASREELQNWKMLEMDVELNEYFRRPQVHRMLAELGLVRPAAITKRIYREVLHTDLDDPYLGLGELVRDPLLLGR